MGDLDELKVDVAAGRAGALTFPAGRNVTQDTVDTMSQYAAIYDLHGVLDDVVPIEAARFFMDVLEEYDVPHNLTEVQDGGHSLEDWQFNVSHPERLNQMFAFIDEHLPPIDDTPPSSCDTITNKTECLALRNKKDKRMCKFKKVPNPNLGCQEK